MKKKKLALATVAVFVTTVWQVPAHAFSVQCASGVRDGEITIICITKWGVGDVLAYYSYSVDSIAVTLPPAPLYSGQKVSRDAVTTSPNSVEHWIKNRPVSAFYVLSQKSTFTGVYECYGDGEERTPLPFRDVTIKAYGRHLSVGGSGGLIGESN